MTTLSCARLSEILDAYGADPARWPAPERAAAQALLASSAEARQLAQAAQALDQLLNRWQPQPAESTLTTRVLAEIARQPQPSAWRNLVARIWDDLGGWQLAGPAFAASLAMGALVPAWIETDANDLPDEDLIAAVQFVDEPPDFGP